jgi:photosystem II stability/assembly factor-like uncharacterized protein
MNFFYEFNRSKAWFLILAGIILVTNSYAAKDESIGKKQDKLIPENRAVPGNVILLGAVKVGNRLLVNGERGRIFYSDDLAVTWKQSSTPVLAALTSMAFVNEKIGIAVGHRGVIMKTTDGGISWKNVKVESDNPQAILNVWMNGRRGIAVGAYGNYLETVDEGDTWIRRRVIDKDFDLHLNAVVADQSMPILLAGESGTIAKYSEKTNHWDKLDSPYEGTYFGGIRLRSGVILLHGMRGVVYRTVDSGKNWKKIELKNYQGAVQSAVQLKDGSVLLVGAAGLVAISKDNGASFAVKQTQERRHISHVVEVDNNQVLIVGEGGARLIKPNSLN